MQPIIPVIMCGGSGTRMWPLSRESYPKQFIPLLGDLSSFQEALAMLQRPDIFATPIVITNRAYRFLVGEQMQAIGAQGQIVLEPVRRDSGPAIAVAAELAWRTAPEAIVLVLAADHAITDREGFINLCLEAAGAATQGYIATLGVKPDHPATGYGYIKPGASVSTHAFAVEQFAEKPDLARAKNYMESGYLWNSGNFVFRADVMRAEIATLEPAMAEAASEAVDKARRDLDFLLLDDVAFGAAPKVSIDYSVMERTTRAVVVPADVGWSDIGSWSAVRPLSRPDAHGNVLRGEAVVMNANNVYVRSDDGLTAVVGVDNVIVVNTGDATLVVGADAAAQVKELVESLAREGRRETLEHRRVYRPWGYYQTVDMGARYQVKRIAVRPGAALSLQKHFHRAEHWIVVRGVAEVQRDDASLLVHENESVYLPIGSVHRLKNPGKIDLELIEVQTGSYLGEDDIVRLEDIYNRA